MSFDNFPGILRWVLVHEGGYVNHPKDPGGATNKGVTQRVYDSWRRARNLSVQSVREIRDNEVEAIYRTQYWDAVRGDDLPSGVNYAVFDFAVNSGPKRAIRFLQREIGVADDGVIGNVTLGALRDVKDMADLVRRFCAARMEWLKTLSTFSTFGRGWSKRVMGVRSGAQDDDTGVIDRASRMARGLRVHAPDEREAGPGKSEHAKPSAAASAKETFSSAGVAEVAKVALPSIPAILSAASDNLPMQIGFAVCAVIATGVVAALILRRRTAE